MVKIFKVGGAVRDKFLGVQSKDIDFAVEAESFEQMRDFIKERGKIFLEKPEFFTIRAKVGDDDADFVLCRKEHGYRDGRRPDAVSIGTIFDDLERRDFTMNAIAETMDGKIVDPFDGVKDIEKKLIRCVGIAEDRFTEDSLRLLRAVRFMVTKGFDLDSKIVACLDNPEVVDKLHNVAVERIREEMNRCFMFDTLATLKMLSDFTLLRDHVFSRGDLRLEATMKKVK